MLQLEALQFLDQLMLQAATPIIRSNEPNSIAPQSIEILLPKARHPVGFGV
ncbi:MAG: hypothetical protein KBS70_06040 [Bacteroidales bacterium]|nr:hypothetical protein [Candidatus Colicola equi]